MKKNYQIQVKKYDVLASVLTDLNVRGEFTYSYDDLIRMGCYYSSYLKMFLTDNGFIDRNKKLIKPIDINKSAYNLKKYAWGKNGNKERCLKGGVPKVDLFTDNRKISLQGYTDKDLSTELRARGYDVKAFKTIDV